MSIEKPANERLNLYNRFKASLQSGDESAFYDADDLIAIIDQAADLQDDYTQMEAIMRGYRYFPDNTELAARRAFLYYDLHIDEGVTNVRKQLPQDSPMARILSIRDVNSSSISVDETCRILDQIIKAPGLLDDEEIIQLIDAASSAGCFQWIKNNEKKLRTKTDYLPTLLYEIFIVSDIEHDREYSLKLLEELTELQPFNIDFWNALAQIQADDSNILYEDPDIFGALNSLDFALAIDNENADALTLKASLLIKLNKADEAERILRPLVDSENKASRNLNSIAARMYACALLAMNSYEKAALYIREFANKFPDADEFVDLALALPPDSDIDSILQVFFNDEAETDIEKFLILGENYFRQGELDKAIRILDFIHRKECLSDKGYRLLFTAYYVAGNYNTCIQLYEELELAQPDFLISEMIIAYLMSLLRVGNKTVVKKAYKQISKRLPINMRATWTLAMSAESIGMNNFMTAVKTLINEPGTIDADAIDVFKYPYSDDL